MVGLNLSSGEALFGVTLLNTNNFLLWSPTIRARGGQGNSTSSVRSQDDVYWKGISDQFHLETSTSDPWIWRRIVFTKKSAYSPAEVAPANYITEQVQFVDTAAPSGLIPPSAGVIPGVKMYSRTLEVLPAPSADIVADRLFQGSRFVDWADYSTAPIDKTQCHVLSDRLRSITSGNDSPVLRRYKQYIPLNKRMRYANLEDGSGETAGGASFASDATTGDWLQDVYILDYFQQPSAAPAQMQVTGSATVYWHER